MRNLTLISGHEVRVPVGNTTCATYDLDEDIIYVASERYTLDGGVEVDLWKVQSQVTEAENLDIPTANFRALSSSDGPSCVQTVSLRFVGESRKVTAIMRGGDVIVVSVEEEGAPFEVEGTFESGILAAAWNPDESVVAIVTGDHKLILLSSLFDVLVESPLYTEDFGQDAPINVGWGSKQTQFHGSLGKAAAQEPHKVKAGVSPDDDLLPRISWRGDGASFVVSSLSPGISDSLSHRTLRVYDRQGVLQSTSEEVPGLEHPLVWRPSGNVIVSTQRFGFDGGGAGREGRHDVIFFERNGLRHGEFSLKAEQLSVKGNDLISQEGRKWGYKVRELAWNSDSTVLAIWIEGDKGDIVQFWTTSNYYWYLKHEVAAASDEGDALGRFTSLSWHPEKPLNFLLTTPRRIFQRIYSWDTFISRTQPPNDSGAVGVIHGSVILLTPFRSQNVPPPMSSHQLSVFPEQSTSCSMVTVTTPIYISFSSEDDILGVLWEHGYVELWSLKIRLAPGNTKIMDPLKVWSGSIAKYGSSTARFRQLALKVIDAQTASYSITTLGVEEASSDYISVTTIVGGLSEKNVFLSLPGRNNRLLTPAVDGVYEMYNGDIFAHESGKNQVEVLASFGEFCIHTHHINLDNETYYIGLSKTGKIYVSKSKNTCSLLSTSAISLAVVCEFIIFTTTTHEALFVPITSLPSLLAESDTQSIHVSERTILGLPKEIPMLWSTRKVERGSRIVVAVPSSMSLVLQMPRGNLETINPRPLVMEVVKQDLDEGRYRKAFFECRKHRIDLNVIVDRNLEKFINDIPSFVDQVQEVDHINLLLTLVGRCNSSPEVVAKVCNAFRRELEMRNLTTYVNSILTAHVVKSPPDHEAGLSLLLRLRDSSPDIVEDAVKYIIFLVDANQLFDTALGMYDFSLVIMIAQNAQKDPREYLPFLRELRALDKYYQRFRIDDHLKRYESALKNLSLAGPERFKEAVSYVEEHRLYEPALAIWKGTDQYKEILNAYGDYLFERREFREAASIFIEAARLKKAMIAHERGLEWQELFDIAVREDFSEADMVDMGYRVAEDLTSKKRYKEAAQVLLDYCKDIRDAVIALTAGNMFSEARRIASLNSAPELVEDIIHPAAFESRAQISEDIGEMREQLRKQVNRLRELRIKKVEEPDAFYGTEDNPALDNVDVMTDISMAPTTFTRYTVAPTAVSRTSRRTSRSKRKMERKAGSGRKGTVDEEEYLLRSVNKLVDRFNLTLGETRGLLPHLFQFTQKHREEGLEMQREVGELETDLKAALDEIWAQPNDEGGVETALETGWAERMAEKARSARINPLDRVEKKEISHAVKDWRVPLYDMT